METEYWSEVYRPVLIHNGYEFNYNKVCLNPEIIVIVKLRSTFWLNIEVAESPLGWCSGYTYNLGSTGSGGICGYTQYCDVYVTRKQAVETMLSYLKNKTKNIFDKYIDKYLFTFLQEEIIL